MPTPSHRLAIVGPVADGDRQVLVLTGDVDLRTAPELRDRIEAASTGGGDVVIDLREVRFMDSPGLGTLVYCGQRLAAAGCTLVVRAPQHGVRELLDMVQLGVVISIER